MEMLLTARPVDADTALQWGLVNRVVPADGLAAAVDEYVETIAGFSAHVIALGKDTVYRQAGLPIDEAYSVAQPVMSGNAAASSRQTGHCPQGKSRET